MSRSQIMKRLLFLASPLGPMGTNEERDRLYQELLNCREPIAVAATILDIVESKPELPSNISREDFEGTAIDLLVELGEEPGVEDYLVQKLRNSVLLAVLLDTLALRSTQSAGPKLVALALSQVTCQTLEQRELVKLVSALGCIGGLEAYEALKVLEERDEWPPEVARELEIALDALTTLQTSPKSLKVYRDDNQDYK
jgi:hypothetical protein